MSDIQGSVRHDTIYENDRQHCYHNNPKVKPEAATAVFELLMMGVRMPETC
jgi:hypothetical protein